MVMMGALVLLPSPLSLKRISSYLSYFSDIFKHLCCADCGERHPAVLQFHHLNSKDKTFNIADAAHNGISLERIKKEIEKCVVLCANCHIIRHFDMRNKKQTRSGIAGEIEELVTLLAVSPEEEDAYNMEFGE